MAASVKENFSNIKNELSDETNKNALTFVLKELKFLLRYISPKKGKAELAYSTGDPALTGQLTGILSILPVMYQRGVSVTPDFTSETFYVRGSFSANGHIQIFRLLGVAYRVYRNKDIKKIIQKFK